MEAACQHTNRAGVLSVMVHAFHPETHACFRQKGMLSMVYDGLSSVVRNSKGVKDRFLIIEGHCPLPGAAAGAADAGGPAPDGGQPP